MGEMTLIEFMIKHAPEIGSLADDLDNISDIEDFTVLEHTAYINLIASFSLFVKALRRMSEERERTIAHKLREMGVNDN